jgi:hypothetical protein
MFFCAGVSAAALSTKGRYLMTWWIFVDRRHKHIDKFIWFPSFSFLNNKLPLCKKDKATD